MATLLLGGLRNEALDWGKKKDYQLAADLTGQANYLGASLQADLLFQKLPELNGGFKILAKADDPYFKIDVRLYALLASEHPIDLCRYQVANCFMGRAGLLSSSDSFGGSDLRKAIRGAIINKRAGGMGLVCGETAYQKSFKEGTLLLEAIQDVYLSEDVGIA